MSVYVMTLAYTACESCGVNFYFHSSQSVINSKSSIIADRNPNTNSASKKRTYNEAMNAGRMSIDEQS